MLQLDRLAEGYFISPDFSASTGSFGPLRKFDTINSVYWTLALEVQFYLIVTLAVLLRPYTNALLAFVTLLSIPFAIDESTYISGICLPYWPMFAIGVLVFQLFERGYLPSRLMGQRAPWISGVLIGASGIAFLPFVLDSRPINMLAFALFVGGILFAAEGLDASFQRLLFVRRSIPAVLIRLLIILGTISYSIYLLHAKLQFFSSQFIRQIFPHDSIAHDLSTIGFTLILCYPFYLLCEKPFIGAREVAKVKPDTLSKELTMPQV